MGVGRELRPAVPDRRRRRRSRGGAPAAGGVLALAVLAAAGCGHGGRRVNGKSVVVRPPTPYDPQADAAGEDMGAPARRGLVLLPVVTPAWLGDDHGHHLDPRAGAAWLDAYKLLAKACDDSFYIWAADSQISATERALAEVAGALTPDDPRVWALRFSCTAKRGAVAEPEAAAAGAKAAGTGKSAPAAAP